MKRTANLDLRKKVRSFACVVMYSLQKGVACGPSQCAHIKTWKTTQLDIEQNMIPLCFKHHREQHDKGWEHMIANYPSVKVYLEQMGWTWEIVNGKFYIFNEAVRQ